MFICIFFMLTSFYNSVGGIQINYIKVPAAVKNNSHHPAILDCNYAVRPDDIELVVKWFLNGDSVYQWIPSKRPQALGVMKDRLDLSHRATDDPKTAYRAMKIKNPTTDVAGEYKCFVSTFADEDFSVRNMIVFEPETSLLLYQGDPGIEKINFTCFAAEVYPEPKIILYKDRRDELHNENSLELTEWNTKRHPTGKYSISVTATAWLDKLSPGSVINCELRIPGTGYVKHKSLLYYPADMMRSSAESLQFNAHIILSLVLSNLICFKK